MFKLWQFSNFYSICNTTYLASSSPKPSSKTRLAPSSSSLWSTNLPIELKFSYVLLPSANTCIVPHIQDATVIHSLTTALTSVCNLQPKNPEQQTHTYTSVLRLPGLSGITWMSRYQNQSGFYWSKRQWVAVASAGKYANLHLTPDR